LLNLVAMMSRLQIGFHIRIGCCRAIAFFFEKEQQGSMSELVFKLLDFNLVPHFFASLENFFLLLFDCLSSFLFVKLRLNLMFFPMK